MITAYVGLGSNLDDPARHVSQALTELDKLPESHVVARSGLYASKPLGPADQPDYINAVAALETALSAAHLLTELHALEHRHGRVRGDLQWGPRTLDLDLLLYGNLEYQELSLTVPHAHLAERSFVLYPLYEIAPDLSIPGKGPLQQLLKHCSRHGLTRLEIQ